MRKALEDVSKLGLKGSMRFHKVPCGRLFDKFRGKENKPHRTPQWYEKKNCFSLRVLTNLKTKLDWFE